MTDLFTPFDLNGLELPNRILMSAMTRTRASEDGVPTDLMRDYYVQRASAGLIVTECTEVSVAIARRTSAHVSVRRSTPYRLRHSTRSHSAANCKRLRHTLSGSRPKALPRKRLRPPGSRCGRRRNRRAGYRSARSRPTTLVTLLPCGLPLRARGPARRTDRSDRRQAPLSAGRRGRLRASRWPRWQASARPGRSRRSGCDRRDFQRSLKAD
jgi:hypothetical protein